MGIYKAGRPQKYNPSTGKGQEPPQKAGEYRLRDSTGRITYIGEACDLKRRMKEHIRTGKLETGSSGGTIEWKVADGRSTSRTRRIHERQKIEQHAPVLNKSKGGEGRISKK